MPIIPFSGSSTSPVPVRIKETVASATIIIASRRRRYRSVRQSLASSTAARVSCPGYCASFPSSPSNTVKASSVAPATPPIPSPLPRRRTFLALDLTIVCPIETCPSPPITTLPPLRTVRMVVPCQEGSSIDDIRSKTRDLRHLGRAQRLCKPFAKDVANPINPYYKAANKGYCMRKSAVKRKTKETNVEVEVALDGTGRASVATGIGFLDHMLDLLARHSRMDIAVNAKGDLHIDH